MKKNIILLILIARAMTGEAQMQAFIYSDSVFMQIKGYSEKKLALDSVKNAYIAEVQQLQKDQQDQYAVLLKPYNVQQNETPEQIMARLGAADKEKYQLLQEADKLLEKRIKTYNKLLEQQYETTVKPYIDRVNKAIEIYAKKNKIDYVWVMEKIGGQLAYFNKSKDITRIIVQMAMEMGRDAG